MATITRKDWLTVDEVAEILRTTRQGIYSMCHRGTAPPHARGAKHLLFPADELDKWLRDRVSENAG